MADQSLVYDPTTNTTHGWVNGKHLTFPGDLTKAKIQTNAPPDPKVTRNADGGINWGQTARDFASDIVPAAVTMFAPEFKAMSPLKAVFTKMGLSTVAGTVADQLLNKVPLPGSPANDKPLLNSMVDSGVNSALGIGIPEAFNVGINIPGITRQTRITAEPTVTERVGQSTTKSSGTSQSTSTGTSNSTNTTTSSTSVPYDEIVIRKDEKGRWVTPYRVKIPRNIGPDMPSAAQLAKMPKAVQEIFNKFQGSADAAPDPGDVYDAIDSFLGKNKPTATNQPGLPQVSTTTSSNSGTSASNTVSGNSGIRQTNSTGSSTTTPGVRVIDRDIGNPGFWGHLIDLVSSFQSYPKVKANGAPVLSPLKSALIGLGLNSVADQLNENQ